ncbi:MAG: pyridoxine 5'-phosphate synthase [Epsilonproteobacteria bacterium]|nr:pyridoxine 5'-phosphate synthase [Campylobacterota bacterium]
MKLGVNIDHIAVLREARRVNDPDPLQALGIVQRAGADQITIHLREDRRHIHDDDAQMIVAQSPLPVNLECSINEEIIDIICRLRPHRATLVPERREEVTTEGGLDIFAYEERLEAVIKKLHAHEIEVSLFVDPDETLMRKSRELGAEWVELHTGRYANIYAMRHSNLPRTRYAVKEWDKQRHELDAMLNQSLRTLQNSASAAQTLGLKVAAGHGLNYQNVRPVADIGPIEELNIGQSIIARSVYTGLEQAVKDMLALIR